MIEMDLFYLKNMSILLDLKIMLKTGTVIAGQLFESTSGAAIAATTGPDWKTLRLSGQSDFTDSQRNQLQKYEKKNHRRSDRMRLLGTASGSQLQKSSGLPAQSGLRPQRSTLKTYWRVVSGC